MAALLPRKRRSGGFTLVEMLVATALLLALFVLLANITNHASLWWLRGESQNQHRQRARAALDYAGAELALALPPLDLTGSNNLQLTVNPPSADSFRYHDSIFWQAPIATDTKAGDIAEVGYFVRWNGTQPALCRLFVNPTDTANYLIYAQPDSWLSENLLNLVAPATKASRYQGLFLENVIGFWVTPVAADGKIYTGFDSRAQGQFPASIQLSLAFLDAPGAARLAGGGTASIVQALSQSATSAEELVQGLPALLKPAATTIRLTVHLDNFHP